jgi:hypothetical protein
VIIRNAGGRWRDITNDPLANPLGPLPMIVEMPDGTLWNPIGKVFRRLSDPAPLVPPASASCAYSTAWLENVTCP